MKLLKTIIARFHAWRAGDPEEHLREDYETLVRLARRCAYDFAHASDYVSTGDNVIQWAPDIDWEGRARWWVAVFAKGNPGKDYRLKMAQRAEDAEEAARALYELCRQHDIKVPAHIESMTCLSPF